MAIFSLPDQNGNLIEFREVGKDYASPKEAFATDGARLTMRYMVPYAQHAGAVFALLGSTTGWETRQTLGGLGPTVTWLHRRTPHRHPTYPWLYAMDLIELTGTGTYLGPDENGMQLYSDAVITVVYRDPLFEVLEDTQVVNPVLQVPDESQLTRYVIRRAPIGREKAFTYLEGVWIFLATGEPCRAPVGSFFTLTTFQYTWMYVPLAVVPMNFYRLAGGSVNLSAFDGCAPGTLLFRAPSFEPVKLLGGAGGAGGIRGYNITLRFDYNPMNWLFQPNPSQQNQFMQVGKAIPGIGNSYLYPQQDFALAFRPSNTG